MNKEIEKIKSFVKYVGLKEYHREINFKIDDIEQNKDILPNKDKFHIAFCNKIKNEIVLSNKIPKEYANFKFIWKTLLHELAHLKPISINAFIEKNGIYDRNDISDLSWEELSHSKSFENEFRRLKKKYPFIYFLESFGEIENEL